MIALASVETAHSQIGTKLQMEITIEAMRQTGHSEDREDAVLQSREKDGNAGLKRLSRLDLVVRSFDQSGKTGVKKIVVFLIAAGKFLPPRFRID